MDEELELFLESLQEHPEAVFIVEGPNDVKALQEQGITNIQRLNTELYLVAEKVAAHYKEAVILTDLDSEGKKLYRRLKSYLTNLGVKVIERPRELFFTTKLRQLEGLSKHIRRQETPR